MVQTSSLSCRQMYGHLSAACPQSALQASKLDLLLAELSSLAHPSSDLQRLKSSGLLHSPKPPGSDWSERRIANSLGIPTAPTCFPGKVSPIHIPVSSVENLFYSILSNIWNLRLEFFFFYQCRYEMIVTYVHFISDFPEYQWDWGYFQMFMVHSFLCSANDLLILFACFLLGCYWILILHQCYGKKVIFPRSWLVISLPYGEFCGR